MFIYKLMLVYFCCSVVYSKDVPITWLSSPRASLPCVVPDADRVVTRRPPPPLNSDDLPRPRQPYLWRKGEEELKRVLSNGTLEVSRKKDGSTEGVYQCAVRHSAGLVLGYPVNLKFAYLDKYFSVNPENATVWEGQSHVLTCDISSGPNASISWQKDGEPLPESKRHYTLKNQLLILDVSQEDGGIYRCKATNSEANRTRVSNGGRLQVEPSSSDRSPAFLPIQHTGYITATVGENVTLACPVTGNPKPTLLWEFTAPGERTAELIYQTEVLTVQDFVMTQQGIYTCTIEENKSMFKTFNISLSVPARITLPPTSKAALQASTVRFNCTAVGNPTPTITWYKNGQPLELTGRTMVLPSALGKRMELLIRSVTSDDAGIYQCFANNGHSVASAWAVFNVTGNTEPAPSGVMCWPTDADHVLVRWPMVNNSMAYTVEISNPDGQVLPSQPLKTTELTHTLDTLTPYKFQIRAYIQQSKSNNNVKASDMSEGVTCQGQGVPIRLSRMNDVVYVSWRHFPSRKVGVKQWILQYKTGEETEEHNITLGPEVSNYTIPAPSSEDLQVRLLGTRQLPWLHQNLTLVPWRSTTNDGQEPGGVTGKIDNVEVSDVGPTKFTVHWRCEEAETSDDDYVYSICTRKLDDKNEKCMESHDKWASVEDLTPSTEYIVRVRAIISSQPDLVTEFTQPLYVSTQSLGQEPIKDLTYKVVNGSTLRVSWHSGVDKYRVYYNDKLVLPIHTWSSVDTVGNTVLIHNVDTSKELYVIVSGYDPVGYSPVLHIPMHVPGAKELDYTFTSKGLTVTWENREPRVVRFSQNLTQPLEQWTTIYVTGDIVHINSLDPTLLTYLEVVAPDQSSSQMFTLPPRQSPDASIHPSSEPISDLTYKVMNGTALQVSWTGLMDRYTVFYNTEMKLPIEQWHSVDTTENTALITNVNRSRELYVVVLGYNPSGHSPVLHIPVHVPKTELNYTFTSSGLTVTWPDRKVRLVRYSQNLTLPQDLWTSVNVTDDIMHISGLNPSRFTYIDVSSPGEEASQVVTVPPRQQDNTSVYHSSEPIMDLTYKVVNSSTLRVSWTSPMDKYTVYYNSALTLPVHHWPSVDTRENTVLLTNVNTSKELYVMVLGYNPVGYSFFLHIPVKVPDSNELKYTFTSSGLAVTWRRQPALRVWYSQNLTQPPDRWASANGTGESITILDLAPSLPTYVVVTAPHQSARVLTVPPRSADNPLVTPSSESIKDLMYKVINGSTIRVSWNSVMDKHTVYYNSDQKLPVNQWPSVETIGTTVLITNVNTSKELYVTVRGYEPDGYSSILHIPANVHEALAYEFTRSGLKVTWRNRQVRVVMYSQNLTQPLERWTVVNVTDNSVHISGLDPLLRTFVVVQAPGQAANQVLTVPPRPPDTSSVYLGVGIGCAVLVLCALLAAAACAWRRSKRPRPPARSRRRSISPSDGNEEEMAEMKNAGGHLANGGTSKDAGEPLLNGHVHITENPIPLKTPNGRMRRGHRYEPTFDMSRYEEPDTTLETTLNSTSSAAFNLLDTSRSPEYDLSRSSQNLSTNNSFNKLPDDNMNSELTRSTDFQLDNSKILPTLQPNG